jgi:fibronectin-binding autotransporter adhesin
VAGSQETFVNFTAESRGDRARVELFGNSTLIIWSHVDPGNPKNTGVTLGSIEGDGVVALGIRTNRNLGRNLTVGSNNLSTTFAGIMEDDGQGGSLTKIGKGRLTLTHANTYLGMTTVIDGQLLVNNRTGSGTGSGAVEVKSGTLGGRGIIAGAVTLGTGSGKGASVAPGKGGTSIGILTIQSAVIFNSEAT